MPLIDGKLGAVKYPVASTKSPFDIVGSAPFNWTLYLSGGTTIKVVDDVGGHKKTIEIMAKSGGQSDLKNDFFSAQTSGFIEIWAQGKTSADDLEIDIRSGNNIHVVMSFDWYAYWFRVYITGWNNLKAITFNKWYHLRIYFDCGTDTTKLWLNGEYLGSYAFYAVATNLDNLYIQGISNVVATSYHYINAVDYSWEAGYYTNRNAFLSVELI